MLLTIIAFIFVLSVVVIVHELGHFIVAKMNNVFVLTFSIGMGPKLIKKRIGETEYAISAIPFGGYVKFAGELEDDGNEEGDEEREKTEEELIEEQVPEYRTYKNKSPIQKMMIVVAGPMMNAILALVLYVGSIWVQGIFRTEPAVIVEEVKKGSPAMAAGIQRGDRILDVDGEPVVPERGLTYHIERKPGDRLRLSVLREQDTLEVDLSPEFNEEEGRYIAGLILGIPPRVGDVKRDGPAWEAGMRKGAYIQSINDTIVITYNDMVERIHGGLGNELRFAWSQDGERMEAVISPESIDIPAGNGDELDIIEAGSIGIGEYYEEYSVSFVEAVQYGSRAYWNMIRAIMDFLKKLVTGKASVKAIGGPLRIGKMAGDMVRWGFGYLVSFIGFFSLNLAIFNLLPILPFDGGHFVLYLYELVSRRPINNRIKNVMMQTGFIVLMILMGLILIIDIFNIFS